MAAQGDNHPLLNDPEQLGLDLEAQLADFVQEDRPAVGGPETAEGVAVRPRERAFDIAEKLGGKQVRRDRGEVNRHQRTTGPRTARVDGLGNQLLARAARSGDQHGSSDGLPT